MLTNTQKIIDKISGEIDTAKSWEKHINGHTDNGKKDYTALDMELQYWFGGRKRLEDVEDWVEKNIIEEA